MKLSVVITTRNEEANIGNCLAAFSKYHDSVELIVVDNASSDRTKDLAQEKGAAVHDFGPERSAQRNFGFRKAAAPWVIVLDADMILPEATIEEILTLIDSEDVADAYYIPEKRLGNSWRMKARNFERSFYDETPIDALRLFKKDVLDKTGGYDEKLLAGAEDWELDIRVLDAGFKTGILKGHLLHNEASVPLKKMLEKKAYYSKSMALYREKWAGHERVKKQFSIHYRFFGVFFENGKWKKVLRHPLLFLSVFFERFAVGLNYLRNK